MNKSKLYPVMMVLLASGGDMFKTTQTFTASIILNSV